MVATAEGHLMQWRVRGSYFEACNCDAICPCRSVHGAPGGPSTFGVCFGTLSWHIQEGYADDVDLSDRRVVMSIRYHDEVQPSTPWEVVLYVDDAVDDAQLARLADIFLGRAGGTVSRLYGPAIGDVIDHCLSLVDRERLLIAHSRLPHAVTSAPPSNTHCPGTASRNGIVHLPGGC